MCTPAAGEPRRRSSSSRHGEFDVPGQALLREVVRDLDLEPVFPLGERRQGHAQRAWELIPGGRIELRRQRTRVERDGRRLVEELFAFGCLLEEVVLEGDVWLLRGIEARVVNEEDDVEL